MLLLPKCSSLILRRLHAARLPARAAWGASLGCHDHDKFDLLIEVHDIMNIEGSGQFSVELQAGRFFARTSQGEAIKTKVELQERLNLHVRQCEKYIVVRVLRHGVVGTDPVGSCQIKVKQDLVDVGFPKRQGYTIMTEGKVCCRVVLSFHRLDTANVNLGVYQLSPLIHQALLHAQYEAEGRGEPLRIDINNMSDLQRLRFFSKVLEGPLKLMSSIGGSWLPLYFKATERRCGKWEWQYWDSKEECLSGAKKKGGYSFLAISLVLPDKYDRNTFYVRYHNYQGVHDLFFRRVDRDRNLWSDGLYEFIERLREYLEKSPGMPAADAYLKNQQEENEKEGKHKGSKDPARSPRSDLGPSRSQDLSDIKRIASPRQTAATEQERPRIAQLKRRMVEGLMMEAASDDSDDRETTEDGKQAPKALNSQLTKTSVKSQLSIARSHEY